MNNKFDELTKSLAQSVTRRGALKKFGIGLAGIALACFGLTKTAQAGKLQGFCQIAGAFDKNWFTGICMDVDGCVFGASMDCPAFGTPGSPTRKGGGGGGFANACGYLYQTSRRCSFTA